MSKLRWMSVLIVALSAFCRQAAALDFYFKDPQYSFQALRAMGAAPGGGADTGVLITLSRITEGDDDQWYSAWRATAEAREQAGDGFRARGSRVSARQEYLRASNYYRTAEFFLHKNPADPRIVETWRKSREQKIAFRPNWETVVTPVVNFAVTREEGAGEHCQIGAASLSNERILDWLDGKMRAAVARPKRTR